MSIELARAQLERGAALHRANQFGLAQSHYEKAVKLDPSNADAWHLLGLAAFQLGIYAKAVKHLTKAVQVRPEFAEAWNNLAIALKAKALQAPVVIAAELDAAQAAFTQAMALRKNYVEAAHNLGILLEARAEYGAAQDAYRTALSWRPQAIDSLTNLGNLLRKQGQCDAALPLLAKADALAPNASSALNLALVRIDLGENKAAMQDAQRALALEPGMLDALASFASAARLEGDLTSALPALRQVAERSLAARLPSASDALLELAIAENASGDYARARTLLVEARKLAPKNERLRWNAAFLVPALMQDDAATAHALAHFSAALTEFEARTDWPKISAHALLEALLTTSIYDLAYLPGDTLALQKRFSLLISEVVTKHIKPRFAIEPSAPGQIDSAVIAPRKRRIGVISSYLREHTVMRYFAGFVSALCAQTDVEVWIWYTGAALDAQTLALKSVADQFEHVKTGIQSTIAEILAADLDIMIYPDVGMDSQQQVYAAWRLARVQAALYGHPITTGLSQMDVYFSGAVLEPERAQDDYSERLVLLPELGTALSAPECRIMRNNDDAAPAKLLCVQNLAKLTPEFDRAIAEILASSTATLSFVDRQPLLTERYLARLRNVLSAHDVEFVRIKLIPACAYLEFMQHLADADLVLDSPWFSGGASSVDTLSAGTPILSWESRFARGRQTSGMLQMLGLNELVASSKDDFVAKALAIISDQKYQIRLRQQITENSHCLFGAAATQQFVAEVLALANAA